MSQASVFRDVIEPDLERIPVLEILHSEKIDGGGDCLFSHVVAKNIFTDFDRRLSRHLAAVRGEGFSRFTVFVRFSEKEAPGKWLDLEPSQHASMPHALAAIADRAVHFGIGQGIIQRRAGRGTGAEPGTAVPLGHAHLNALAEALKLCDVIGEAEFLEISGDYDVVFCRPPGDQRALTIYLRRGSVSLPNGRADDSGMSEHPLAGFRSGIGENVRAQTYVATARHALVAAKEAAVSEFRAAAEDQIMTFDRALRGRPLDGYRMDSALSLVARLRAGLGDQLRGLGEHARITALDWSAAAESAGRRTGVPRAEDGAMIHEIR